MHAGSGGGCIVVSGSGRLRCDQTETAASTLLKQLATPEPAQAPSRVAQPRPFLCRQLRNSRQMRSIRLALALVAVALTVLCTSVTAAVPDPLRLRPPGCTADNCTGCLEYSLHVSCFVVVHRWC